MRELRARKNNVSYDLLEGNALYDILEEEHEARPIRRKDRKEAKGNEPSKPASAAPSLPAPPASKPVPEIINRDKAKPGEPLSVSFSRGQHTFPSVRVQGDRAKGEINLRHATNAHDCAFPGFRSNRELSAEFSPARFGRGSGAHPEDRL